MVIVQKAASKDVHQVLVLEMYVLLIVVGREVVLVHKLGLSNSKILPSASLH
jgi:hypothetical protein